MASEHAHKVRVVRVGGGCGLGEGDLCSEWPLRRLGTPMIPALSHELSRILSQTIRALALFEAWPYLLRIFP